MEPRRWIVVGAGAVGGTIGGRLHQGAADVAFVARGAHGEALQRDGLLLRDPDDEAVLMIPTSLAVADVGWGDGDVAIVATKTQDAEAVLDLLAAEAGADVPVVCATNGLETERMALRRFAHVHAMCVLLPAAHLRPGVVEVSTGPVTGVLDVGLATGGTDGLDEELATALRAGRFVADPDPRIMARKRTKLLMNLANIVEAAVGKDNLPRDVIDAARTEGKAVFDAAGLPFISEAEDRARRGDHFRLRPVKGVLRGGGSTWQSLARGSGRTEVDYLNGEIVLLGRLHAVPTPVNARLQQLAWHLAAGRVPPESMSSAELRAWLAA
jgi:2-dehydropantoate 2-reductase